VKNALKFAEYAIQIIRFLKYFLAMKTIKKQDFYNYNVAIALKLKALIILSKHNMNNNKIQQ